MLTANPMTANQINWDHEKNSHNLESRLARTQWSARVRSCHLGSFHNVFIFRLLLKITVEWTTESFLISLALSLRAYLTIKSNFFLLSLLTASTVNNNPKTFHTAQSILRIRMTSQITAWNIALVELRCVEGLEVGLSNTSLNSCYSNLDSFFFLLFFVEIFLFLCFPLSLRVYAEEAKRSVGRQEQHTYLACVRA